MNACESFRLLKETSESAIGTTCLYDCSQNLQVRKGVQAAVAATIFRFVNEHDEQIAHVVGICKSIDAFGDRRVRGLEAIQREE